MTELPFADSTFDCVYATESLEHAVEIERAVAEMCRVLKPGGRLVIIDKNAEHWGRLKTPGVGTVVSAAGNWRNCWRGIAGRCRSEFISYWEDVAPDGLFLVWLAQK